MKKLFALLTVLMLVLSASFALAECPCADGNDLCTSATEGTDPNKDYISSNWSYPPFGLSNGALCLHGNQAMVLYGQACVRIHTGGNAYLYDCKGYGELVNDPNAFDFPMLHIQSGASLVIDGGFYKGQGKSGTNATTAIKNEGTLTIYDAVITGTPALSGNDFILGTGSVLIEKTDNRIIVAKHPKILFPTATESVGVMEGDTVTLSVQTKDWRPLTYQWYRDGQPISGATQAEYSFSAANANNGSKYHCVVTNDVDLSASSANFALTVTSLGGDDAPGSDEVPNVPATGDNTPIALCMVMMLMAGAAFLCLRKKALR